MFIEVKGKPKSVIIQKRTKANKWVDVGSVILIEGIDYTTARNILHSCHDISNVDYRLILRGKKSQREYQVLSSRSYDFYNILEQMEIDNSIYLLVDGLKMVSNNSNPRCMCINKFIDMVRSYGGIAKANMRPRCIDDGYLKTYDITYVNGNKSTISIFNS